MSRWQVYSNVSEPPIPMPGLLNDIAPIIISRYQALESIAHLARSYNVADGVIKRVLREHNVKLRSRSQVNQRYPCDHTFFDVIDTEEKAYWLGFLYADGCITRDKVLTVTLVESDHLLLRRLSAVLCMGVDRTRSYARSGNSQSIGQLNVTSRPLFRSLTSHGCVPRKTKILTFPTNDHVPTYLTHHFVRGYFDGDGSISPHSRSKSYKGVTTTIVSTMAFCNALQSWLTEHSIYSRIYTFKHTQAAVALHINRVASTPLFYHLLYDNAHIWLPRKRERFIRHLCARGLTNTETNASCPLLESVPPQAIVHSEPVPTRHRSA
jgi:hypothetical protein